MKTNTYQVKGFYQGASKSPLIFSLDAVDTKMVWAFVRGYLPTFVITEITEGKPDSNQHYRFSTVNPVISARTHLKSRRRSTKRKLRKQMTQV